MTTPNEDLVLIPAEDEEYAAWIAAHPHGYVIHARKSQSGQMMWHRADCGHIQPDGSLRWVTRGAIKACSLNPGALAEWAKRRPEALAYCQTCRDKWLGER